MTGKTWNVHDKRTPYQGQVLRRIAMSQKVFSPFDESYVDEVPITKEDSAERALSLAYETYTDRSEWLPLYERIEILEKTYTILQNEKESLIKTAILEGGKPYKDSVVEMDRALQGIKIAISAIGQLKGEEINMGLTPASMQHIAYTYREPVGPVFAISAFNHPLNLIIHQVIPAIITGCPILIKPATKTPLSCFNIVNALYEAGLPRQWCQALVCDHAVTEKIAADPRIRFLSFIGSAKLGWHLRAKLAPGAHCTLEHGGAAPVIVEADADLEKAIPLLVKSSFYHAGQVCVSTQRIFVHESILSTFCQKLLDQTRQLSTGDPLDPSTDVGPLINPSEVNRIEEWVLNAIAQGTEVLCGAKKLSLTCYSPTILLNPPPTALVSREEIFGPVVCVYSYSDRAKALSMANNTAFAFQAAVFTQNINVARECVEKLEATTVMINDHTAFRVDWMPFGGRKHSGLGVGGIPYTMKDMTFEKLWVLKI